VCANGVDIYEEIRNTLFQDNATAGEAAGYAMGLIMLGSASNKALEEMLAYARETQHEKIIRSLAVGVALVMYGTRELADPIIDELMAEKVGDSRLCQVTQLICRMLSCATEECSPSPSLTLVPATTRLSESCFTSLSQTSPMMSVEPLSPLSDLSCSETTPRSRASFSSWQRVTIRTFDTERPLLSVSRVPEQVFKSVNPYPGPLRVLTTRRP
jgi:hypothetical protein